MITQYFIYYIINNNVSLHFSFNFKILLYTYIFAGIPQTPVGYYDCQLNIITDDSTKIVKTLRSQYECITIQQENLQEAKQIIQSKVSSAGIIIDSVNGQIPRVYFQKDLCEKVEKQQCVDSGYDQQVQFFDEYYYNDELQEDQSSTQFQNDQWFQPWRYIVNTSSQGKYISCTNSYNDYIEYVNGEKKCVNPSYVEFYERNQNGERIYVQQCSKYYIDSEEPHRCVESCVNEFCVLYDNKICISSCPHMYQNQSNVCVKVWDDKTKTYDCNLYMNETYDNELEQGIEIFKTEYECIDIPQDKEKQFRTYFWTDFYNCVYPDDDNQEDIQDNINHHIFKGQFPRVYFSERLCKLLENDKCKKLDKQQQVEYKEGWQEDNKWKYEEEFYQFESFIQWQYIGEKYYSQIHNSTKTGDDTKTNDNKLSAGAIAGIVIGSVAAIGIIVFVVLYCLKQNKQQNTNKQNVDVEMQPQQNALQPTMLPQQGAINTNNLQNNNLITPAQYPQQQ